MGYQPLVVVLGGSLLVDGVAIGLEKAQINNIIRVDPNIADTRPYLQSLQPDLIILELNDPRIESTLHLLKANPDISLLGINDSHSRALVLKTQEYTINTMQDFHELLQQVLHQKSRLFKGGGFTEYQTKPEA
jgi:hypothetical protein